MANKRNEEIIRLRQQGKTCKKIAEIFGISDSRVSQIYMEWQREQSQVQALQNQASEDSLLHLLTAQFSMTRSDGRPSHIPGSAYIAFARYWESVYPGKIPTIDDFCAMAERELRSIPNLGKALMDYLLEVKRQVIRLKILEGLGELSLGKILMPEKRDASVDTHMMQIAVYIRMGQDTTGGTSAAEQVMKDYQARVEALTGQSAARFFVDYGADQFALRELLTACEEGEFNLIYTKSIRLFSGSLAETERIVDALKHMNPPIGIFFAEYSRYTLNEKSEEAWRQFLEMVSEET